MHDQPGSSSLVALPSSIPASCYHFLMLAREEERNVEGSHLPLKGMTQKLRKSLLTSHWTEHNHMTILASREAGNVVFTWMAQFPFQGCIAHKRGCGYCGTMGCLCHEWVTTSLGVGWSCCGVR